MERLHALPNAGDYFDFSGRRFVGFRNRRSVRAIPASEGLKQWDLWVSQALAALAALHDAGLVHGSIDASALVVNEDGDLRIGGLTTVQEEADIAPVEPFNPNNLTLPPEQNLYAAFKAAVPFQAAFQTLQQANWSMDQLETIYPAIQFTRPVMFGIYERVQSAPAYRDMRKAGDVWMLGFALLTVYYQWLEWPYVLTTEFHETRHEAFLDLIETMVRVNPADRVSAVEALKVWAPSEVIPIGNTATASDANVVNDAETAVAATVTAAVTGGSLPLPKRRPYLALQSHSAGRNRTRKSSRS